MDYVKVKTRLRDDPKVIGLSDAAFRAFIHALCWSGEHETDGVVPLALIPRGCRRALADSGLLIIRESEAVFPNWGKHQLTRAEMDAKRIAGRNAARSRWGNATPSTEVEVQEEVEEEEHRNAEGKGALRAVPTNRPDEDQVYLASRLAKAWDQELTIPALQKLNTAHGRVAVTDALRQLHGFPPAEAIRSLYAYVDSIAAEAVSA